MEEILLNTFNEVFDFSHSIIWLKCLNYVLTSAIVLLAATSGGVCYLAGKNPYFSGDGYVRDFCGRNTPKHF